jgi:hypothetical protein
MRNHWSTAAALLAALVLAACSEAPKTGSETSTSTESKETAGPPQPVSGKTAYWEMYKSARNWAKDLQPLTLVSKEIPGIKNEDGKAAMWDATFISPSQREARVFTYAIVAHPPDIYKGVTIGKPLPWNGPTHNSLPFMMTNVTVDSDAAYKTAAADADAWLKKNPDKPLSMTLQNNARFQLPYWYMMWGTTKLGYAVVVNGTNGSVIHAK